MSTPGSEDPRPLGWNLVALAANRVVVAVSTFVVQVLIARYLGREGFGTVGFLTALTGLLAVLFHLGSDQLVARHIARHPERAATWLARGMTLTGLSALLGSGSVVGYVAARYGLGALVVQAALASIAFALFSQGLQLNAAFQALRRVDLQLTGTILGRSTLFAATLVFLTLGWGVTGVFGAQIFAWLVCIAAWLVVLARVAGPPRLPATLREAARLGRASTSFGTAALFGAIYLTSDVLIVKEFHGDGEVGLYRAAATFVVQLAVFGTLFTRGLFPALARRTGRPAEAGAEIDFSIRMLLAAGVPLAVGGMLVAEPLMTFVMGSQYRQAVLPLTVMLPLLPARYLKNVLGSALTALDRQAQRARGTVYAALFNVAANFCVVPFYGAAGAAATTVLTEVLLIGYLYRRTKEVATGISLPTSMARTILPTASMLPALFLLRNAHVLYQIASAALIYAIVAALSGAFNRNDLARLRRI